MTYQFLYLGLPGKKSMRAAERNNYKRGWFRRRAHSYSQRRFIFVDESGVNTAMRRRYGRAPRGERAHDSAPRNYGAHTSLISAMGLRGLVATLTVEGAVDADCFNAYAGRVLGPRLRRGLLVLVGTRVKAAISFQNCPLRQPTSAGDMLVLLHLVDRSQDALRDLCPRFHPVRTFGNRSAVTRDCLQASKLRSLPLTRA